MTNDRSQGRTISIALIVSLALAGVVTLVLVAFAIFFYRGEREQRWAQLHTSVAVSADELAVAVALPAWNFDESQILAIMASGLNNQEMVASVVAPTSSRRQYVLTRDGARLVAGETPPDAPGMLSERRTIVVAGQNIGSVTMYATAALLEEQLHQRLLTLIGIIVVLDVTLVASLYLLLWLLMLKPLKAVGDYAATVKAGESVAAATPQRAWFFGELKRLNESIREMIALLDRRYQAMHRSEERLQMATSAASIGIWDWNLVSNELNWDEQMFRLFSADKYSAAPRLDIWFAAMLEEDREAAAQAMAAARRGESEFDIEFRIAWPGGNVRHIKADAITFRDDAGRPVRMVGTNYDITDHKEAELELRRHRNHLEELVDERTRALSVAVTQAQAANRAKSVFLANMSHELRTPLNSVIGFSRLMAGSTNMLPEEKRNLAIIHRSGNHLLTLINDILELSKIEAGRVVAQTEVIGLGELLQEVMDMVSMRAGQSGIALRLDCAGTPPTARVDGTKLRQVLLNLLSNAVKFALQGEVTLRVRGEAQTGDNWRLSFAVIDDGIGIAPADQERIFEPFIQAEGEGAKEGTGLGLTISREFVRLLGGQLTLQSAPGQGSVFSFSIPVLAAGLLPLALGGEVATLVPEQRGKRILVVDDNADGCELLVNLLTPLGFLVEAVSDGASALAAIARWQPELILMDWRMPGLDGLEVTRLVRSRPGLVQPRIVMLTASAFEEEKQAALAAGADEFLRKPVEQEMLYLALEQQLGLHFMRRQPAAPPALRTPLSAADVARLTPPLRAALKAAVQELNLARVAALLAPLPADLAEVVERIETMLNQHQYPPLCALLDDAEPGRNTERTHKERA
jgi:signal transduction histidine kinase/CheY-like chemotaxis protein